MTEYLDKEKPRITKMITRFLIPMLDKEMEILSVGCGAGSDVLVLRHLGFKVYGIDPSRLNFDHIDKRYRHLFHIATMEDHVANDNKKYDFIYALDVIEHVGCQNFGTILEEDAHDQRVRFLEACYLALKPGGVLLLTTSNRVCPIDIGHWHKYHWLGRMFTGMNKFGISIPWSEKNFLLSGKQIHQLFSSAVDPRKFSQKYVKTALYPNLTGFKTILRYLLYIVDRPALIGSPVAPLLIVQITKTKNE